MMRTRLVFLLTSLLTVALFATPASATFSSNAISQSQATAVSKGTSDGSAAPQADVFATYNLDGEPMGDYPCTPFEWALPNVPIGFYFNECNTRVLLHQNINGTGWIFCISPDSIGGPPATYLYPGLLTVTTNTQDC